MDTTMRALVMMALSLGIAGCAAPDAGAPATPSSGTWTSPPQTVLTDAEIQSEVAAKVEKVRAFLAAEKLDAVLLTQVRNVNWMTAGVANTQIVLNKDVGAASLLIRKDGARFLLCNGAESARLMDESLAKLGYTLAFFDWYRANPVEDVRAEVLRKAAGPGTIGSDVPFPGTTLVADRFAPLRHSLSDTEIKRYRWLGRQTAEAIEAVCREITPGMDEFQIEAMTSAALRARGILPTVLLIAADERIARYRHALPGGAKVKSYAMVNVVAEKWGMPMSTTRFVHFGPLPADLNDRLQKTARVMAQYQAATVPGVSAAEIFEKMKTWYAEAGVPDEWKLHHQGGAIGYDDREWVIYPGIRQTVQDRQAFAWNPTITGAKVEDTIIAYRDSIEVVTKTGAWPTINVTIDGRTYPQPAILVR
jgi:antitoxin VapB